MIRKKYLKLCASLLVLSTLTMPVAGCSSKNDKDNVARPPVATTDENGQTDPNMVNWGKINEEDPEDISTDLSILQDLDAGYFVGASDILNAYYTFDNPINYYTEWPENGLYMPTESEYQQAILYYQLVIDELEKMDLSQMDEEEVRLVEDMLFSFRLYVEIYDHYLYMPQLTPKGGSQVTYPMLTSLIQFNSKDDIDRYFVILGDYYEYFEAAVNVEQKRSESGIGWNDDGLDLIIADCNYLCEDRDNHFLKTTFAERLEGLELTEQEKADYIAKNQELLDTVFFPTMEMLVTRLEGLKGMCNDEPYLASSEEGKVYYESLFHLHTSTTISVEDAAVMLQDKIDQVYEEYSPRWESEGVQFDYGLMTFDEAREWCELYVEKHLQPIRKNEVSIYEVPEAFADSMRPASYLNSPIDNSTKHSVWLNTGLIDSPEYDMYTLVAHEMYPGHLYQHQYHAEALDYNYQAFATDLAYAEGWAEYSEWIMIHNSPFDHRQAENNWMFRTFFNVLISARLSIGVEYEGWSYEKCLEYVKKYGQGKEYLDSFWENLTTTQCFAVEYAFGYIYTSEILENALKELEGICSEDEVYQAYLALGSAPFDILKEDMQKFVDENQS